MLRRWVRLVVALATTLAAWLVVMPARAAAPLCDDRGATTFAPAPQLQAPETSIDVGDAEAGCFDGFAALQALDTGGAPSQASAPQGFEATLPTSLAVANAPYAVTPPPHAEARLVPPGVRDRVDRPPRG